MTGPKSKLELGGEKVAYGSTPSPSSRKAWPTPACPAPALLFGVSVATSRIIPSPFKAVGANCKAMVHVPAGPRVTEIAEYGATTVLPLHTTFVIENAELEPSREMPFTAKGAPPVFLNVSCWLALLPRFTGPKSIGPMF